MRELATFPELADIAALVIIGDYDEGERGEDIEGLGVTLIN
jgi:hypothetical protein